jgi:putative heme-binding domain-containing protein
VLPRAVTDSSVAVRREAAIALHHNHLPQVPEWWTSLALQHDGKDRWYLEALGIGADRQWNACLAAYLKKTGDPLATTAGKDIIWRARTDLSIPYLARLAADPAVPLKNRQRYFRAFDFNTGTAKYTALLNMIQQHDPNDLAFHKLALHALDLASVQRSSIAQQALKNVLESVKGTAEFVELADQYSVVSARPDLLELALQHPDEDMGVSAAGLLLKLGGKAAVKPVLMGYDKDTAAAKHLLEAIARVGSGASVDLVQDLALGDAYPEALRKLAAARIGWTGTGEQRVLTLLRQHKVPQALIPDVVASVDGAWMQSVKDEAASYLPSGTITVANTRKEPVMATINSLQPDPAKGKEIFSSTCSTCHKAGATGFDFGPNLSEIGTKLPKEALLEAIVHPSAGIGFGYEGWNIRLKDGASFSAIIVSKTETDLEVKFPGGARKQYKTRDIAGMEQMKKSMMTEGLYARLSDQDLADLLDFLVSLRRN